LTLSPPREISRTAVNQLALPYIFFIRVDQAEALRGAPSQRRHQDPKHLSGAGKALLVQHVLRHLKDRKHQVVRRLQSRRLHWKGGTERGLDQSQETVQGAAGGQGRRTTFDNR
jgi:hypothetical protein